MDYRVEEDSIGKKEIPKDAYYGINSLRAKENFYVSDDKMHGQMIASLGHIKKACAMANYEAGLLFEEEARAISEACEEVIQGDFNEEFIVDPIQGGAGTSSNMNANEVIANRASQLLGHDLGSYKIHPNDHVNKGQSTNDVYGTAGKITIYSMVENLILEIESLIKAFEDKAQDFSSVLKMGRTQLQDAVPMTLGQEFAAYASLFARDLDRIKSSREKLTEINLAGSAIGTGINVNKDYSEKAIPLLSQSTGIELSKAHNMIDGTAHIDVVAEISSCLKILGINLSKVSNDLRLLSSGPITMVGDISLPARQAGSSIMPGKVNPVIPELVNQVAFKVIGNDLTVSMAVESGQLQLNAFEPVAFYCIFESIEFLTNAINTLRINCIDGIRANKEKLRLDVENSSGILTLLVPKIGYEKSSQLAKDSQEKNISALELLREEDFLSDEEIDQLIEELSRT